jgi:2-iminobutanoate/2-iminopropanoate deaminase
MKRMNVKVVLALSLVLLVATVAFAEHPKALYPPTMSPNGLYSPGIKYGQLVFVSGQICAETSDACKVDGDLDITASTGVVMGNILAILQEAKMDFDNVLMVTVYLKNYSDFTAFNALYGPYFANSDHIPARAAIGGVAIPKGSLLEISVIAGK